MEFKNLSLIEIDELIRSGKTTSQEVYEYFLARTKQYNPELNAFNTLPEEFSIVCSRHPELAKDPGNQKNGCFVPQHDGSSLPVAIKDIFCEVGVPTQAASKMLENFVPPYESTVTERMKQAGFVNFGKTNMDEFAMGGSGENSAFGPAKNPWDTTRIPGGSSSGSAVAVAAGLVPAALGTDT